MFRRINHLSVLLFLTAALLVGCSAETSLNPPKQASPASDSSVTDVIITDSTPKPTDNEPSETSTQPLSETDSPAASDISPNTETVTEIPSVPIASTNNPDKELPERPPETASTEPPQKEVRHISSITYSLQKYISKNEPYPYLRGTPIYQVLYNGSRVQVGDSLIYRLSVSPADHDDTLKIIASENLSCSLSGDTLTVKVLKADQYGMGAFSVIGMNGQAVSAGFDISYTVDNGGNPYDELSRILSDYIRHKGMEYCTVTDGYTKANPSLSITRYPDAPAWDDMIDKSQKDWLSNAFSLVDEYAEQGFKKVNFIITDTSIGFCASK